MEKVNWKEKNLKQMFKELNKVTTENKVLQSSIKSTEKNIQFNLLKLQ